METAPSKAAGDQRGSLGRLGPGLIYFSINKTMHLLRSGIGESRCRSLAFFCRHLSSGRARRRRRRASAWFFTAALMQQACLPVCFLLTDSLSFWYGTVLTPRTHMDSLKQRHLLCFILPEESKVCECVCYPNTCSVCSLNDPQSFTNRHQMQDEGGCLTRDDVMQNQYLQVK